jgi:uncharacterized protein (TIGR03000 family)
MNARRTLLSLTGTVLLTVVSPALAQRGGGHSAPAPAAARSTFSATGHDVIPACGLGPNAGFHSAAPLTPRGGFSFGPGGPGPVSNPSAPPLIGAPNTFFPSQTTGFSTRPLFPYSSATFPYGYGFTAREPEDETQGKPPSRHFEAATPDVNSATMNVRVPADAEIWFEGSKTGQSGTTRTFVSPPLESGRGFTYEVRAHWTENGKEVDQTRQVHVRAGEKVDVDFGPKK